LYDALATQSTISAGSSDPRGTTTGDGHLAGALVRPRDHRGVGDVGTREQQRLQLGGRDLARVDLDQLLGVVDDVHVAAVVDEAKVARREPALASISSAVAAGLPMTARRGPSRAC
jgi:hypothetical protein